MDVQGRDAVSGTIGFRRFHYYEAILVLDDRESFLREYRDSGFRKCLNNVAGWRKVAELVWNGSEYASVGRRRWLIGRDWLRFWDRVPVPLVMRKGTDDYDLTELVRSALASIDLRDVAVAEATGPRSWPMRTMGFPARHLLGAVVRGKPMRLAVDELEILAYATNVAILGPKEEAYRARAALERGLAFSDAYLTWNEESQAFEDELLEIHQSTNGDIVGTRKRLSAVQERIDVASLDSEEWNVLYRLRLQLEQVAERRDRAD